MIRRKNNAGLQEIAKELRALFPKLETGNSRTNLYIVERTNPMKPPVSDKIKFELVPECERPVIAVCFGMHIVTQEHVDLYKPPKRESINLGSNSADTNRHNFEKFFQ